ncbi:MAG: PrsW family intramembrane metalloprotease, partial [Cyclobacteriaceae bacterium]
MILEGILIFFVIFSFGSYVAVKFSQSRNKKIFFKAGVYRPFIWTVILLILAAIVVTLLFSSQPIDLSFLQLEADEGLDPELYREEGQWFRYYWFQMVEFFTSLNLLGLLSALLVLSAWLYYVRSLDFFHREGAKYSVVTLLLGMLFTFLVFPLGDLFEAVLTISYSSSALYNLFVYSFLGIGLVEETVKLIPVLLILWFTDKIDEPFDLIYYACLSALGFAFIENLQYFQDLSGSVLMGRALTAAVGHMINATIVVYGILLYKFHPTKNGWWLIILYFLLGSFLHGLYNYLLFEDHWMIFMIFFILLIQAWIVAINNAINNSKHFDYGIVFQHDKVKFRLALFLT